MGLIHELEAAISALNEFQDAGTWNRSTFLKMLIAIIGVQQRQNPITAATRTRDARISCLSTVPWPFAACKDGLTAAWCRRIDQ